MNYFWTYLKGLAMGAADVVPGVSGGTIAFITGIYDTLLGSIRKVNPSLLGLWKREGFKAVLLHINAGFLIALFGGILTSILTLAKLISWLLVTHPIPLWSFFFGLILISVVHILKQVEDRRLHHASRRPEMEPDRRPLRCPQHLARHDQGRPDSRMRGDCRRRTPDRRSHGR